VLVVELGEDHASVFERLTARVTTGNEDRERDRGRGPNGPLVFSNRTATSDEPCRSGIYDAEEQLLEPLSAHSLGEISPPVELGRSGAFAAESQSLAQLAPDHQCVPLIRANFAAGVGVAPCGSLGDAPEPVGSRLARPRTKSL